MLNNFINDIGIKSLALGLLKLIKLNDLKLSLLLKYFYKFLIRLDF